jgi:hypothetical protein
MGARSKIEWTDSTFNPWVGCTKVARARDAPSACDFCYAEKWAKRSGRIESDNSPMESLLPDLVATFVAAGPLLVEQRRQREEAERQRQIAERKRYEEQQRRKLDDNRWRRFIELAQQRRNAEIARAFLEALKTTNFDPQREVAGNSIADWIAWVGGRLSDADPINYGADAIFEAIAKVTTWTYGD